ncbi:MAG: hypothetical protein V1844_17195 [Pseudomonadota bacterium]
MPEKKQTTKKQKVKRDMMDFIEAASHDDSTVGMHFLDELNKDDVSAKDLHRLIVGWGFDGVRLKDLTRLLEIFKTKDRAKNAMLETGY